MNQLLLFSVLLSSLLAIMGCGNSVSLTKSMQTEEGLLTQAQEQSDRVSPPQLSLNQSFNYDDYAAVLKTYVNNNGLVDYQKLQQERWLLERFNASLATVTPEIYNSWNQSEQIAFWINAYNSLTLQSIIAQNPLKKSIRDIPGVWKGRKFEIVGEFKTLDNIEHDILRKEFNEPRIHAALVCAAVSCPPLRQEPYLATKLEQQLDDQVRKFLNSSHGFKIDRQQERIYLSSIFKWFGKDWLESYQIDNQFTGSKNERAVLNFLSNYLNPEDSLYLKKGKYRISYLSYDWSLNQQ